MTEDREVVEAARAFVASTDVFGQPYQCRERFARLAVAVRRLPVEAAVIDLAVERAKRRPAPTVA